MAYGTVLNILAASLAPTANPSASPSSSPMSDAGPGLNQASEIIGIVGLSGLAVGIIGGMCAYYLPKLAATVKTDPTNGNTTPLLSPSDAVPAHALVMASAVRKEDQCVVALES